MNGLTSERIHDFAGHVVSALHEIGDNNAVSNSFSSVGAKKSPHSKRFI
jgi:hypothetical protein